MLEILRLEMATRRQQMPTLFKIGRSFRYRSDKIVKESRAEALTLCILKKRAVHVLAETLWNAKFVRRVEHLCSLSM